MLRFVTPHSRLASVLDLQFESLRSLGIEGLLLDIDCTLKDYKAVEFRAEIIAWIQALREAGFQLCLLSNGRSARIELLAKQLEIPFVAEAFKPFPFGCRVALQKLGLSCTQVALIGDQLFADVLAGRLAGLHTILVHPTSPEEPWFTRLKRPLERQVLRILSGAPIIVDIPQDPALPRSGDVTP